MRTGPFEPISDRLSIAENLTVFAVSSALVLIAGTLSTRYARVIAEHGAGQALVGSVLLGGIASLPEMATAMFAARLGNASLAVNTLLGGIGMSTESRHRFCTIRRSGMKIGKHVSHSFLHHTGEIELELRASTLKDVFLEAGRALAELMLGDDQAPGATVRESIAVRTSGREALLVKWLNELLLNAKVEKAVFTQFQIPQLSERGLMAETHGIVRPVLKTAVKAASQHRFRMQQEDGDWIASVVLDL